MPKTWAGAVFFQESSRPLWSSSLLKGTLCEMKNARVTDKAEQVIVHRMPFHMSDRMRNEGGV